ncbi:MAG: MarR family winged helix-turn-helix transcriptional regulator [Arachnia propionica]|uniref:MarR family winged helix-turn-helix transcriptional regulator n=1 Tax=Arachnia propionica TaxID=1750 RepID=UPI0027020607|nr:MarR family winged helix-turn-helix transcriptional regulator [Arachnia propionica]
MQRYRNELSGSSLLLEAWFLNQVVSRWMTTRLGECPLSPDELGLCAALALRGDASTSQICELTGTAASTIASMGNRLAGRGILEQVTNPHDRRSRLWRLTRTGLQVLGEAMERFREAYLALLRTTPVQPEQIRDGLNDLEHALRLDLGLPPREPQDACAAESEELTAAEREELRRFTQWLIHRRGHASDEGVR